MPSRVRPDLAVGVVGQPDVVEQGVDAVLGRRDAGSRFRSAV